MLFDHFWLICGLWVGIVGALYGKYRAREHVSSGVLKAVEVNTFLKGYSVSILIPSIIFWVLQLSSGNNVGIDFLLWPNPQQLIALTLLFAIWGVLFIWVLFLGGSRTLSRFLPLITHLSGPITKEVSIKIGVVIIIASGVLSLSLDRV